jgi:hypothetical protein
MFGLENKTLIVSLCVTLIISSAIFYYVRNKLSLIEQAQLEQAQVLQNLIQNSQSPYPGYNYPPNDLTKEQLQSMQQSSTLEDQEPDMLFKAENPQDKISISDSESSDSESYSDSDSDESEIDVKKQTVTVVPSDVNIDNVKVIEMHDETTLLGNLQQVDLNVNNEQEVNKISEDDGNEQKEDSEDEDSEDEDSEDEDSEDEDSEDGSNDDSEKTEQNVVDYNEFKVPALRDLVLSKGLVTSKNKATQLKKNELIELLEN